MRKSLQKHGWTMGHLWAALAMVTIGVIATWSAWCDIALYAYKDEEQSQVFLALPVAAWLIWMRRRRFRTCQPRGRFIGPIAVGLGWAISAFGYRHAMTSLWHGGAVMVAVGCLLTILGKDVLMRFFPAFAVLVFLVPVPQSIRIHLAHPMQRATAQVTQGVFDMLGEDVDRSENKLTINGNAVNVAEACNGMRMVFSLLIVSYAFAFGEPLRNYVRLIILAASPFSAILCNVIRMIPTVWLYGYGGATTAKRFHDLAGWVMLGVAFLLLLGIISLLKWAMIPIRRYTLASD